MVSWSLFPLGMDDAWLLPTLCFVAFVVIVLWGRYLPREGSYLAIGAIGLGFILFWFVLIDLLQRGPGAYRLPWFEVGGYRIEIGMILDPLSVVMLGIVTFVALMVQVYSLGYMRGEPRFGWYFAAHSLFAAAMLTLVLADNFILLYIAWELVGLCSYLLIGFWYERRSAAEAAKKAFVTTRLGDVGFLIGVLVLFSATGTFSMPATFEAAEGGQIAPGVLTLAALLLFLGAMGKSAQFPLHVWLPDAMEGPTPVSALIHAATMVAAGVYLVARTFPIFLHAPGALAVVSIIGLITTLLASTMAIVMSDLKRILAYSTISKLGFMMMALGSGAAGLTAAIFYLMTHAFFKALLFLGAGSLMHGTGKTEIWDMQGLGRKMPITAVTFLLGTLALAGFPLLSGFWSKDEILAVVLDGQHPIIFGLALVAALLSALYMARPAFVIFFAPPPKEGHAHESGPVMTVPLVLLAVLAVLAGFLALGEVGRGLGLPGGFGEFVYAEEPEPFHLRWGLALLSSFIALLGIGIGWAFYHGRIWSATAVARGLGPLYRLIRNKYYMDDLYQAITDMVFLVFCRFIALFDRKVVNDTGVDGTGKLTVLAGEGLRYHETGKVYNYGLAIVVGIVVIIALAGVFQG